MNDHIYIAMPFVPGVSLKNHPTQSRYEALDIIIAVLEATKKLHDQGIVHNDLHSENIIIHKDKKWVATAIDFDFSRTKGERNHHLSDGKFAHPSADIFKLAASFSDLSVINRVGRDIISLVRSYPTYYNAATLLELFNLIKYMKELQSNKIDSKNPDLVLKEELDNLIKHHPDLYVNILYNDISQSFDEKYHAPPLPIVLLIKYMEYHPFQCHKITFLYKNEQIVQSFKKIYSNKEKLLAYCNLVLESNDDSFFNSLDLMSKVGNVFFIPSFQQIITNFNLLRKFIERKPHNPYPHSSSNKDFILRLIGINFISYLLRQNKYYALQSIIAYKYFDKEFGKQLLLGLNLSVADIKHFLIYFIESDAGIQKINNFNHTLTCILSLVDDYFGLDANLYKRALTSVNEIYQKYLEDKLAKSCCGGFRLFGTSYTAKLDQAKKLNLLLTQPADLKEPVLNPEIVNKCKLGLIAQRINKQ